MDKDVSEGLCCSYSGSLFLKNKSEGSGNNLSTQERATCTVTAAAAQMKPPHSLFSVISLRRVSSLLPLLLQRAV